MKATEPRFVGGLRRTGTDLRRQYPVALRPLRPSGHKQGCAALTPSGTPSGAPWVCAALGALHRFGAPKGVEGEGRGGL